MRRELTWQAVVSALLVAAVVSASYPYVVLKLGMGPNVSVVSAFLGAILPSWQHHLLSDYLMVGLYFVTLIAGVTASVWAAPPLMARRGMGWTLALACAAASLAS